MTTPTDTASIARRQVHLETLETIAELVGEFVLAIVRMANDPAMDVGQAPELLGRSGNRLGDVREMLPKARRDAIEACSRIHILLGARGPVPGRGLLPVVLLPIMAGYRKLSGDEDEWAGRVPQCRYQPRINSDRSARSASAPR